MIWIYRKDASKSAFRLTKALGDHGVDVTRVKDGVQFLPKAGDLVVNWGSYVPRVPAGVRVMNQNRPENKLDELVKLQRGGTPVPPFNRVKPAGADWMARTHIHHEAKDLLAGLAQGDYYVQFVSTIREFRVHSWLGRSIRVGLKVPWPGKTVHPHFRSWAGGWDFSYGDDCQALITQGIRNAAFKAVADLGLDFGAVDIAVRPDSSLVVWEVNTSPGIEGGLVEVYARKVIEAAVAAAGG